MMIDREDKVGSISFGVTITPLPPGIVAWTLYDSGPVYGPYPAVAMAHQTQRLTVGVGLKVSTYERKNAPARKDGQPAPRGASATYETEFDRRCEFYGYHQGSSEAEGVASDLEYPAEDWPKVLLLDEGFAINESPWCERKYVFFVEASAHRALVERDREAAKALAEEESL